MQVYLTHTQSNSNSSKQCLIGIQVADGVNLVSLRSTPESPGASSLRVRPSGSSDRPGRRLAPSRRDLFVITYKYRGQSANMHKTLK